MWYIQNLVGIVNILYACLYKYLIILKAQIKQDLCYCLALFVSHLILEGEPNANHVHARIRNSRTQQLHN
jgi:hypothetical protein